MKKLFKQILVSGAALLMLASVGAGVNATTNTTHAAKLSSFPPSTTKVVKLTKSVKADDVYNPGTMKLKVVKHHTKLHRGETLKVDLAEAEGFGFNVRSHRHPETDYRGYSLPIKDAKYFKIIRHGHKHARKHYHRHAKRHASHKSHKRRNRK